MVETSVISNLEGTWLLVSEAAQVLKLTEAAVRQRAQRNELSKRRGPTGRLEVLVSQEAVESWHATSKLLTTPAQPDATEAYWLAQLRRRDVQIGRLQERVRALSEQLWATQQALTALAQRQALPAEELGDDGDETVEERA